MRAGTIVVAIAVPLALVITACGRSEKPASTAPAPTTEPSTAASSTAAPPATGATAMPLQKTDLSPGNGAEIKAGQTALVHYTGWLHDPAAPENKGKQFDSSVGGEPFEFAVGAGHVIAGWDQGVAGMKVGGKRRLVIPPEMGYGARGAGGGLIPPNATLVFDVELVEIR
jgi:FKBP-type peptidyl-prolyl cis-trans isomerase FkpA